jgi:hypothetical protein
MRKALVTRPGLLVEIQTWYLRNKEEEYYLLNRTDWLRETY